MAKQKTLEYATSDISFAASLLCLGKKLICSSPREDRPYEREFYYMDDGTLDDLLVDFMNGSLLVDPNLFMNNVRMLKASLRQ